jgi:hypothetical protein
VKYNNKEARDNILRRMEAEGKPDPFGSNQPKFKNWINLCIHPSDWDTVYKRVKSNTTLSFETWEALQGVVFALLVYMNKSTRETKEVLNDVVIDFVDFIRKDKASDPWRFLHSMRRYYPRYAILKTLATFGIEWRTVAYEVMGANFKPSPRSYHSVFTNIYVRTLVKAVVIYKHYRTALDADFDDGVNDMHSLLLLHSASSKCLPYNRLEATVNLLLSVLPNWTPSVRSKVSYMLGYLQPASVLYELQMLPSTERKVLGNSSKD